MRIRTEDGYVATYAHLKMCIAKEGDKVSQGEIVALSGNSGRSTGAHLHYSLKKNDTLVDPMKYMVLEDE